MTKKEAAQHAVLINTIKTIRVNDLIGQIRKNECEQMFIQGFDYSLKKVVEWCNKRHISVEDINDLIVYVNNS